MENQDNHDQDQEIQDNNPQTIEVGAVYNGKVKAVVAYGAFVEIVPGTDGLLHISQIANHRINDMEETGIRRGDMIEVKLIGIDPSSGKLKLSRKVLL